MLMVRAQQTSFLNLVPKGWEGAVVWASPWEERVGHRTKWAGGPNQSGLLHAPRQRPGCQEDTRGAFRLARAPTPAIQKTAKVEVHAAQGPPARRPPRPAPCAASVAILMAEDGVWGDTTVPAQVT